MNQFILTGVINTAEVAYTKNNKSYCKFSVDYEEGYVDNVKVVTSGEITCWKNAEKIAELPIRTPVLVHGMVKSAEFKGKNYTNLLAFNVIPIGEASDSGKDDVVPF